LIFLRFKQCREWGLMPFYGSFKKQQWPLRPYLLRDPSIRDIWKFVIKTFQVLPIKRFFNWGSVFPPLMTTTEFILAKILCKNYYFKKWFTNFKCIVNFFFIGVTKLNTPLFMWRRQISKSPHGANPIK